MHFLQLGLPSQDTEEVESINIHPLLDKDRTELDDVVVDVDLQGNLMMHGDLVTNYSQ